jgi:dihydroneopterin aldolase
MIDAPPLDCVVIGAGPAGCSAASWADQMGLRVAVVDRAAAPCATLAALDFAQDWVLGHPQEPLHSIGSRLAAHAPAAGIAWQLGATVNGRAARRRLGGGAGRWPDPARRCADHRDRRGRCGPGLFHRRHGADGCSRLDCSARDAAAGARAAAGRRRQRAETPATSPSGHAVTLWTRGDWRARPGSSPRWRHRASYGGTPRARHAAPAAGRRPRPPGAGNETFDGRADVLFGYEPEPAPWDWLNQALASADEMHAPLRPGQPSEALGVFVAGDAAGRWHPSVQTALADGVVAARQVAAFVHPDTGARTMATSRAPLSMLNSQVLQLTGLRFGANLGVLAHERDGPQPIQVDAELNLGEQPALPRDAEIAHVLDYRKVRQIIIDECTAEHTDLLESLLAKLCVRLMRLPGVLGVRIRVAKLKIFDDCEVAIRCEAGLW